MSPAIIIKTRRKANSFIASCFALLLTLAPIVTALSLCHWFDWHAHRTRRLYGPPTTSYYAALLPRRGPHIASHSVCLSVCPSVCPSVPLSSVTSRHLANYNDTHVLFGRRRGPHIVRPSRPHKLVYNWITILQMTHACLPFAYSTGIALLSHLRLD